MSIYICPHVNCTTPRVNTNVKYRLWVIMMCHCRFINCIKCTTLVQDLTMEKAVHEWGQKVYGKSLPSSRFCCEPKIALKNKGYILKFYNT